MRKGNLDRLCRCLQAAELWPTLVGIMIPFPTTHFTALLQLLDQHGSGRETGLWRHTPEAELGLNLFLTSYYDLRQRA